MSVVEIELHVRRQADLPTLLALAEAFERAGREVVLTATDAVSSTPTDGEPPASGPVPCRVRVIVNDDGDAPEESAEKLCVIEDRLLPPPSAEDVSSGLRRADLILVPGPDHVRELADRTDAEVVATGVARLAPIFADPELALRSARRALRVQTPCRASSRHG